MKSRIVSRKNETEFPKLMHSGELVVLFWSFGNGTVVHPNKTHFVGYYCTTWHMNDFEYFEGTIELSNK